MNMMINLDETINEQIEILTRQLKNLLGREIVTYDIIKKNNTQGIYVIFDKVNISYIGITTRQGKKRMQELTSDYRSHTFNRKLLTERFKELKLVTQPLKKDSKTDLINNNIMSKEFFVQQQTAINDYIKNELQFIFLPIADTNLLKRLEHFAIAVINPPYND